MSPHPTSSQGELSSRSKAPLHLPGRSFQLVELLDAPEDGRFGRLLYLTREEELIEDHVHFVKVEHQVELAHVAKELVKHLDKEVDRLEESELVVARIDAQGEEEASIPSVDELVLTELHEVGELGVTARHEPMDLALNLVLLIVGVRAVVLRQAGLTLPVLQQDKLNHRFTSPLNPLLALLRARRARLAIGAFPNDGGGSRS
eukprot:CAMPEP_0119409604 /NCGR_PEP_ID=MMETSP1335-20130426/2856_1 /TAXON_ID=259385 /ORGANISM="Chrysoculter rhomboideus, Strain RCC1486" /LENGTH=202 /DNA_ID=CAMNT_0007434005 /DNA_START=307 /DNA_END=913 /DNA_ORIENTATION=+